MLDVIIDSLIDSLKVVAIFFVVNVILGLVEGKLSKIVERSKGLSPLIGGAVGLIPQCGFSVIATDMYQKNKITVGTLLAVYISTSDEAIPVLLSHPDCYKELLALLLIKFALAVIVGIIIDKTRMFSKAYSANIASEQDHVEELKGCCDHEIGEESKLHSLILHPLVHSLKTLAYIFAINLAFGTLLYFIGEEKLIAFLTSGKYLAPLVSVLIGLIPNCASSLLISNLFSLKAIGFGAMLGGLIVNAGLGVMVLIKDKKNVKTNFGIVGVLIFVGLLSGYLATVIYG